MRLVAYSFALVALLQCVGTCRADAPAGTSGSVLAEAAAKKAAEELVAAPINEFWKDAYEAVVRKKGSRALRRLRYWLAGLLGRSDPRNLAKFLMGRLKDEVFEGAVNDAMWDALTMELYFLLRDWWTSTPENPRESADLGAWQALVSLYKELLAPTLRGSRRVGALNDILLDPDLQSIKRWVNEWKGEKPKKSTSTTSTNGGM